jgi:hypothetical protein
MASVTNRIAASAQRGEGVMVSLNDSDALNVLPTLTKGQKCTNGNSKVGYIAELDYLGRSFIVSPDYLTSFFDSSATPAVLAVGETLTII